MYFLHYIAKCKTIEYREIRRTHEQKW